MANNRVRMRQDELIRIEQALDCLSYHGNLYKLLKRKLSEHGYWRARPRGKPELCNLSAYQRDTDMQMGA